MIFRIIFATIIPYKYKLIVLLFYYDYDYKLHQQFQSRMRKNNNKSSTKSNYDYLNFIRKNQQIVNEFKQITQIDQRVNQMKKMFSNPGNPQRSTIDPDRYSQPPIKFQDSIFNYRQRAKFEITSLKQVFQTGARRQIDSPIKTRKQNDFTQRSGKSQFYSRNLVIPSKTEKDKGADQKIQIHEAYSQIKFPKLNNKQSFDEQHEHHSSSDSSLSAGKEIKFSSKSKTKKVERLNEDNWKRKYAPISLDATRKGKEESQTVRCKVKSLKLTDGKHRINQKLIKTYYDYQNLLQLKERVAELLPTFKPLQSKKRQRIQIWQIEQQINKNQLQQYLESNIIARSQKIEERAHEKNRNKSCTPALESQQKTQQCQALQQIPETQSIEPIDMLNCEDEKQAQKQPTSQKQVSPSKQSRPKKQIKLPQSNPNAQQQTVYQNKIHSYRQFLFLVNFAHRVFDPVVLRDDPDKNKIENKYKFYIGPGNNSLLVKSLMKRRFWWTQVDDPKQANFAWTQLKINSYYQFQPKTQLVDKYDKLDSEHPYAVPKPKKLQKSKPTLDSNKKQDQPKVGGILRGQLPEGEKKIFTNADNLRLAQMLERATEQNPHMKNFSKFQNRLKYLPENFLKKREQQYSSIHMHNHLLYNYQIGNKKAMFYNLKHYYEIKGMDPWNSLPLTFHIKKGVNDPQYAKFMKEYKKIKMELEKAEKSNGSKKKLSRNVWIVKPGELSNRGNGITVIDQVYELNTILKSKDKHNNGIQKTYIVQKYIQKPMLYKNRKFDIRHYMMISRLHGRMRAYWFSQGYIRTSSCQYNIEEVGDVMIHLTNDAIQKHSATYGKYQQGNKISYAEFQRYLDSTYPEKKYSFIESIYPRMREIAGDAVKSTCMWMDPDNLQHNFEIFGLDFMIDANFQVWLIEVNTNPCLQLSSGLLGRIIPTMLQNSLRLALDPIFPPTAHYLNTIKYLAPDSPMDRLQFELIFDQGRDGLEIEELMKKHGKANCGEIEEEDETYENDGKQIELGEVQ